MKKNRQILLTCVISIAILLITYFLLTAHNSNEEYTVYLLSADLDAGTAISGGMFNPVQISKDADIPNLVLTIGEMEGKILLRNMKTGDILSVNDLGSASGGVTYPKLSEGMELYSVSMRPENANGWWIYEGNSVNLYIYQPEPAAYNPKGAEESDLVRNLCDEVIVIENIRIMRILNDSGETAVPGDKNSRIICLELTSEQVRLLVASEKGGIVRLSARNNGTSG